MRLEALKVMRQAASELGLPVPTGGIGSQEQSSAQLMSLLNSAGYELTYAYDWNFLIRKATVITVVGQSAYALPADFERIINQTIWTSSSVEPMKGPLSPQSWQMLTEGNLGPVITDGFRIQNFQLHLVPTPTEGGQEITFEYLSNGWVQGYLDPEVYTNYITNDYDTPLFDFWLLVKLLKIKMWQAKGLDTTAYEEDFGRLFNAMIGTDKGARILSIGRRHGGNLIGYRNAPETGYGL